MKHIYSIDNLDCANCANKIEVKLNKEPYIKEAELNFMLKKLTVISDEADEEALRSRIERLADGIEKGVKVLSHKAKVKVQQTVCDCQCGEGDLQHYGDGHGQEASYEAKEGNGQHHVLQYKEGHNHNHNHNHDPINQHRKIKYDTHAHTHQEVHNHSHAHDHNHGHDTHNKTGRTLLIVGLILFGLGILIENSILTLNVLNGKHVIGNVLFIAAYICVGYDIVAVAFRNLVRGSMLDENFLMTLATIAAFAIGEYPEAVAVMVFYKIGEYMQDRAVGYSRKEIAKAMDIRPDFARVIRAGKEQIMSPQEVRIGDILEVRVGEKLPLDGVIVEGTSSLDTSMLTGEAVPVFVNEGSQVLSGSINKEGIIKVKVTTSFDESTVSKILELIENATSKKSKSENFITKFARWYTPIVVGLAVFTAIVPSLITGNWQEWVYSSIVFLVISCPCAVVVSVPLGFFAGLGASAHKGVLVKGSNYLEELNTIDTIVLDKTGTITKGEFGITEIVPVGTSQEEILKLAAALEKNSNHPIARSIVKAYANQPAYTLSDVKEMSGEGIVASLEGKLVLAGNEKLMARYNIEVNSISAIGSHIYVAKDNQYLGCIIVADQIKEDSKEAIAKLKDRGIKKVVMLTGDKAEIAHKVGKEVGVDEVYAELLPQDKVAKVEALLETSRVAFVGDGINDAPVLARADIGIAMGGVGSDAAIEASDVVLMTDELSSIGEVLGVAKRTRVIVTQNIIFALGVKVIVLLLGMLGIANMWLAIFADVGVSLLAVMNSIRVLGGNLGYIKTMMKN